MWEDRSSPATYVLMTVQWLNIASIINFGDGHGKIDWYSLFYSIESIDIPLLKKGRGRPRELI